MKREDIATHFKHETRSPMEQEFSPAKNPGGNSAGLFFRRELPDELGAQVHSPVKDNVNASRELDISKNEGVVAKAIVTANSKLNPSFVEFLAHADAFGVIDGAEGAVNITQEVVQSRNSCVHGTLLIGESQTTHHTNASDQGVGRFDVDLASGRGFAIAAQTRIGQLDLGFNKGCLLYTSDAADE